MDSLTRYKQCNKEEFVKVLIEQRGEGCNVHGVLHVNKVAGNINIVPGKFIMMNTRYVIDTNQIDLSGDGLFNTSHTIQKISFGKEYPGMQNPLSGLNRVWNIPNTSGMFEYLVKIVPTKYKTFSGELIQTNQYSATEYTIDIDPSSLSKAGVAGFFLMYELSPISVSFKEENMAFLTFLINLLAILGGVFTVASLIDSVLYGGFKRLQKKVELGQKQKINSTFL